MSNEPSDVPDASATVLYVGNLDRRVTDVMLLNILRTGLEHIQDKIVSAKMFCPTDPAQGADGYCFVQFKDNNAACQSMSFLNGRDFFGKTVKVNWATNSATGPQGGQGGYKIIGSSVTIFVGDLDDDITDAELKQAFDPFGEILNAKVVRDTMTQKSKNYGFISFSNKPDAEKAIRDMHGAMLKRRPIKTNWATRNQKTPQQTDLDYDTVYKETSMENCTVYVTNLPDRVTDETITRHFEKYGRIVGKPRLFEGKNFCFIKYDTHDTATKAIVEGNGTDLSGSVLKCWWGKENSADNQNGPSSNYSNSNRGYQQNQYNTMNSMNNQQQQNMYQQYMQYYGNQQYQQQYYQYWMQYQQMMQQAANANQGGAGGAQQTPSQQYPYQQMQTTTQQQAYSQQQNGVYPASSYQN